MAHEFYYTVEKPAVTEYRDRGSRFIAFAYPLSDKDEFKKRLNELKKEHPSATHHCFAYRLGLDRNDFRVSDAGEPSGTAGQHILGQIDSRQLTNILVVIVRYFGGTLLGVPGLINAYRSATAMVLQLTPIVQKPVEVIYRIQFAYPLMNEVMTIIKKYNCRVIRQEMQLFCELTTGIAVNRQEEVLYRMNEVPGVELSRE